MKMIVRKMGEYTPTSDGRPGRQLANHTDRSGSTIHALPSIGFGSIFVIVGSSVGVLAWLGKLNASSGVPRWLGPVIGALFAIAGLSFVMHGISGLRVRRRAARLRVTHVREPWVWDHPWDESGSRDDSARRIGRAIWITAFLTLFAVPFNWLGFFSPERPLPFAIGAGVVDCLVAGCGWWAVPLIARRAKFGVSTLRFRQFPMRPGTEIELQLPRPPLLAAVDAPEALLRCVQERYEMRGTGKDRSQVVVAYEVWSATERAALEREAYVWRFAVPDGLPGTALSERPPRYWELELKVETPGVDYAGTFLVPVYADGRRR